MPMVRECFTVACFIIIPAGSIVRCMTSAAKAEPLSVRMVFGTYAFLVKIDIRPLTTDSASGCLKGIANMHLENTSTVVKMSVKPLEGGGGPSNSNSNRSSGPMLRS